MVLPIGPDIDGVGLGDPSGLLGGLSSLTAPAQSMARSSSGGNYTSWNSPFYVGGAAETPVTAISSALPWIGVLGVAWLILKK